MGTELEGDGLYGIHTSGIQKPNVATHFFRISFRLLERKLEQLARVVRGLFPNRLNVAHTRLGIGPPSVDRTYIY